MPDGNFGLHRDGNLHSRLPGEIDCSQDALARTQRDPPQIEAHITHCSNALPLPPDLRHLEISMPILPFLPAEILQSADQPAKEVKKRVKRRVLLEQIIARLQQMHGHPKILEIKGYCPFFREEPQAPTGGVDDGDVAKQSTSRRQPMRNAWPPHRCVMCRTKSSLW